MSRRETETLRSNSGSKTQIDPNVGIAAKQNADTAQASLDAGQRAQAFAEDFQKQYVVPALQEQTASSQRTQDRLDQEAAQAQAMQQEYLTLARQQQAAAERSQAKVDAVTDQSLAQMKLQDERYRAQGIPAEDRYYAMVNDYSADDYAERQAGMALGDIKSAAANENQSLRRSLAAMGIDPSSPAAISAMTDASTRTAAMGAAASNQAREAAKTLGMTLKSDAANFGRGGLSGILQFGQQAAGAAGSTAGQQGAAAQGYSGLALNSGAQGIGATTGGYNVAAGNLSGVNNSAGIPMAGYGANISGAGTALKGYGANLDAYTTLAKQKMANDAAESAGFGQFLGTIGGAALSANPWTSLGKTALAAGR